MKLRPDERHLSAISTVRKTVIYVGVNEKLVGALAFADQIRGQTPVALDALRKLGVEKFVILAATLPDVISARSCHLCLILLAMKCNHQFSGTTPVAVLTQINTLPGAEIKRSICNGNAYRRTEQRAFDVRSHIIRAFQRVLIKRDVFRDHPLKMGFKVAADGGVGIFVNRQAGTGMLNENMSNPCLDIFDL